MFECELCKEHHLHLRWDGKKKKQNVKKDRKKGGGGGSLKCVGYIAGLIIF